MAGKRPKGSGDLEVTPVTRLAPSTRTYETKSHTDDIYCAGLSGKSRQLVRNTVTRCSITNSGYSALQSLLQRKIAENSFGEEYDMLDKLLSNHFVSETVWR
jgi:hypothetical protein